MLPPRWLLSSVLLALSCASPAPVAHSPTEAPPSPVATLSPTSSQPEADSAPCSVQDIPVPESPPPPQLRNFSQPLANPEDTRALVLMYHAFDRGSADLTVDGWQFDRQLTWLRNNQIEIVSTSEVVRFLRGEQKLPARVAVVTIDDGDKSVYGVAWPILKRHAALFTLALPTKLMNENKKHRMLTWDQVREMVDSGLCEVASHGHEHKSIIHFSNDSAARELQTSRDILEKETGQRPIAFFYPLGAFDDRTAAIVEKVGYHAAFKATGAPVGLDCCNLFAIPRVGIVHRDTTWTLGFYYSPTFLDRMMRLRRTSR